MLSQPNLTVIGVWAEIGKSTSISDQIHIDYKDCFTKGKYSVYFLSLSFSFFLSHTIIGLTWSPLVIQCIGTSGRHSSHLPFRQLTGTTIVDYYFHYSFPLLLPFFFSSPSQPFLIEGVLGSKNLFCESGREHPKTKGFTPFQPPSAILGPPGGHFGFLRFS